MHPVPHILVRAMTHSRSGGRYYRPRAMSLENPKILEALTIYEKLKRCQEEDQELDSEQNHEFRGDHNNQQDIFDSKSANDHKLQLEAEEPLPLDPFSPNFDHVMDENRELMAYSKYKDVNLQDANYLYFSAETGLIQSQTLEGLSEEEEEMNYKELLLSKKYWLDVVNPTDNDLTLLSSAFRVHELTIRDIRGNTEEKLEMYNHYTFVSLKLMKEPNKKETKHNNTNSKKNPSEETLFHQQPFCPNSKKHQKYSSSCSCGRLEDNEEKDEEKEYLNLDLEDEISNEETSNTCLSPPSTTNDHEESDSFYLPTHSDYVESDADLKILVFADFIITIHKIKWESVKDVLGFLSILFDYGGSTPPMPEWVLFSIFVELAQEAKFAVRKITPTILSMRAAQLRQEGGLGVDVFKLSNVLRQNFQYEFELHKICRFIKPKLQVLRSIQLKGRRRFPNVPGVVRFLANVGSEFDELLDELDNLSRVVERSQDTFLALASVQQSLEANEMGEIMKRISEIAMIFLPVQAIAGFLGMNVKVPFQEEGSTFPFWTIVMGSVIIAASLFIGKRLILCRKKYCAKVDLCPSINSMKKSATTRYEKSKLSQKLKGL